MRLNITMKNNKVVSQFVKDEHIKQFGVMVDELVKAKIEGGTLEYNESSVSASEIKAITIEFE
ncbi:Uncharacterised protein [[Clostridium] sordellii]|uniref:hypothetical protein n=1 Tax=Paraclostridium sordellii TaxID=1505 RepID=UPI0005E11F0A|nr:hypothetical protein [Paeniclostridium sordellii]CEP40991.1 Uncharacterised protein [[Clostridium] sordellii] [Paeniclostridium sordellii]